ncbi:MAG: PQQ-binding-like beta-propeller repeat protein [Dehalococcoidia bacterium]
MQVPDLLQVEDPKVSVRFLQVGISGSIQTDLLTADLTGNGEEEVLVGTSRGIYILSRGTLLHYIPTSSSVMDMALLDDVTGDDQPDLAVAVGDTYFPNIRVYDSATGRKVWQFVPKQEVFIDNLMWTEQQTLTFDLETVDVNSDGVRDVIATSGYRVYALDGKAGGQIWKFEASDNLWRVAITPDLNGDGVPDLAVGGQNGSMYALSGVDGLLLWQTKLVARYDVIDYERGRIWRTVDRSVWDIVPVDFLGVSWAVVSTEDGYVRLVDLREGTVQWEYQAVEHVDALLSRYYDKDGNATSPGDFHFFNLRVFLAPDITGDGVEEILAAAYLGRRPDGELETRGAGLFLINPATGRALWENTRLELGGVSQMEITSLDGKPVILLPSGGVEVIDLQDGQPIEEDSASGSSVGSWHVVKSLGDGEFLLASTYGDLIGVSSSGEVLWDYPGVADVGMERGDFTGDETQDILVRSKVYLQDREPRARVLYVIDGATKEMAWSYVMPYEEFAATGGIAGIQVAPDLNQDGKQDIIGFIQPPGERPEPGEQTEDSQIVVLSGSDGSVLLQQPVVTQTYYGVWQELYNDPSIIEQGIIRQFEVDMEKRFPEELARQEKQMRDEFERRQIPEQWDRYQRETREEFERQHLPDAWDRYQEDRWNEFEPQLQAELEELRGEGWTEEDLASYEQQQRDDFEKQSQGEWEGWQQGQWDDFEQQLEGERGDWEQEMRDAFERQLPEMRAEQERQWRENFEEYELPAQLEQWQERLDNEEQGRRIGKFITSLDVIRDANAEEGEVAAALVVGGGGDVFIVSPTGELLWTRTSEPGKYQDPFTGEEDPEMLFGLQVEDPWGSLYRVPGDLNGDGIDDLVVFTNREIVVGLSTTEDGGLGFEPGPVIEFEQGGDPREARLVDDLDGDGVRDIFYLKHQEGQGPTGIFVSTATGKELLRVEQLEELHSLDLASADLDGDGTADTLLYRRWSELGPRLQVVSGRGRSVIWEITYQEGGKQAPRPEGGEGRGYQEGPLPAAPISDITGDDVADLAVVQNLVWQAGARVVIYDVARDEVVKEIVLEEIGSVSGRELRWQPGLLVREVGDVTGDGVRELAVVTALGTTEQAKEFRLMVVDVRQGQIVADFRVTGSEVFDLGGASEFGVLGFTGEVYLVDVANDLRIASPAEGSLQTSPLTIQWTGVAAGTFSQVFVDGVEIARTNEYEFTVPVAQGEHQVAIRSLDEHGRGVYRTANFTVEKGSTPIVLAIGGTALLVAIALWLPVSGFVAAYWRRKEHHG